MKLLFVLALNIFAFTANANKLSNDKATGVPIANAGADQTIYLNQGSTATLNGSASSGDTYQWTDVSTDYKSGATITSPQSAVTTVTGLKQGVWYFQLAVTSSGVTATDVVVIRVDYDLPPSGGNLIHSFLMSDNASVINDRHDTVSYFPVSDLNYGQSGTEPNHFYLFRDRLNGLQIDDQNGKMYSTIQDGYAGTDGFPRAEIGLSDYDFLIDTSHTYLFEWKGYFPQNYNYLTSWYQILTTMQIHSGTQVATVWGIDLDANGNLISGDVYDNGSGLVTVNHIIGNLSTFYDNAHTIRLTMREGKGYPGQTAFFQLQVDGVTVYSRNTGQVGSSSWNDYVKFGGLYDWNSAMVNGNDLWRGRKFQLVTEAFNVYQLGNNQSPTANAGPNQTITLPTNNVTLSGSGTDPDGTISSYQWSQLSGPSGGTINNPNSASTTVSGLAQGVYQFQLKVTDNQGATAISITQITVKTTNIPPVANAGSDQTITLPANSINLSGSGSDVDGTISSYSWSEISGTAATIKNSSSASTIVTGLTQGNYQFELTVKDDKGATGKDTVKITVNPAPNKPPVANAGTDQTITLPTDSIILTGSGIDSDGTVASYLWTKISGPSATISNSTLASTTVNGLVQGSYQFELTVIDDKGAAGTDIVNVTVNLAGNIPPTANAGADQTITLPTDSITLTGSGIDSDGTIASYLWTKISGPSATISKSTLASTTVNGLVQGSYQFELTVTDNKGAVGTDMVNVTVNPAPNKPPVANAGTDQTITLPTNSITLIGIGKDSDGTIAYYLWTKISGPLATISNSALASTTVKGLVQGNYQFELTVTDDKGAVGKDIVNVTVNPAPNKPPVANAGTDQTITLPTNSITLAGIGNDSDGSISSYLWTKISGPSATISNSALASTTVKGLVQGNYQFELTVIDDKGAVGKDTVKITVNPAPDIPPTANAGPDQAITLPTSSIILKGSGIDSDGTISAYSWVKISGPAVKMLHSSSAAVTIKGLVQGNYQFELTVTDNKGVVGKDTVDVTVNAAIIAANIPPIANAGTDQTITLPINSITLTGIGNDSDGTIASYLWTKISGRSATISNTTSPSTIVNGLLQGKYQFELIVTDDKGAVGTDIVNITVNPAPNIPPTANAGTDKTITLPTDSITLTGSGNDSDGTIASYLWTKISGPSATISNGTLASTTVNGLVQGNYQFALTVTDDKGAKGKDTVNVTVNPDLNKPPAANAGSDQTITLPTDSIILTGSGNDSDGTVSSYLWTKVFGPSATISDNTLASTTVNGLVQGNYQFELTVTDDKGAVGKDTVSVTVNPAPNIPPTANAGTDQTITLPTDSITLTGNGNDSDGTIISYLWTKISGPSATISNSALASTTVKGLVQGNYQFELTVTDDKGAAGTDIVNVTVNPAPNKPPTANAGTDQTITLPTDSITLTGSGNDIDGTISSYLWTKISGPSAAISNSRLASTTVKGLVQGNYQFELTVTDDKGAVGKDIVNVTVNPAPNIPPTANAGTNQTITLPTDSITLTGSGNDIDGTISSYLWTKISGPSAIISNSRLASTIVKGLVEGNYQFALTVTDNKGAVGKDIVNVTVNPAPNIPPTANAGTNQTITLPTDSITLTGSGNDIDGTISSYLWTKISGPSAAISNSRLASTTVKGLVEGNYQFALTVTDDKGAAGKDIVNVTVNPAPNKPPTANAGPDQTITLPTKSVSVSGNGSDSDGTIVSYQWLKISGPSSYSILNQTSASTEITGLQEGVYEFQLKVTDNKGSTANDTLQITVVATAVPSNQPVNIAPIANAGSDITIISPSSSVNLAGTGSDEDGTIKSYIWKQLSGPSVANILNANSPSTSVTGLIGGTYEYQLTVVDDKGAEGKDTVSVTVALARLAPQTKKFNIYPNPVHTIATIEFTTLYSNTNVGIVITSMSGSTVYKKDFVSNSMEVTQQIDMSNLIKGVYVVSVFFDGIKQQSSKVIRL